MLTLPAVWKGKANPDAELHAIHGLILDRKADTLDVKRTADGQTVTGTIHGGDFGGYWPSKTDLTISVALTGPAVEAIITARNVGNEAEPMGIGWLAISAVNEGRVRFIPTDGKGRPFPVFINTHNYLVCPDSDKKYFLNDVKEVNADRRSGVRVFGFFFAKPPCDKATQHLEAITAS